MRLLDELNALLNDANLGLPSTQSRVHSNGKNLLWIRKALGKRTDINPRINELLKLNANQLAKES